MTRIKNNPSAQQQKGSALIVALLIVTLVATIATMITLQQQTQIAQTSLILNNDRTYLYAKAVQNWAISTLLDNLQQAQEQAMNTSSNVNYIIVDALPKSFEEIRINHAYRITGHIDDAQGRFNLNNLVNKKYESHFVNLMLALDPALDSDDAKAIAKATREWVTRPPEEQKTVENNISEQQATTTAKSGISRAYLKHKPPYRAAQALMASASELRLIKGMTPSLYLRLQPFIIALPKTTPININTASAPVIASLGTGIALSEAIQIVQNRESAPFSQLGDFLNDNMTQRANISRSEITLNSTYFLVTSECQTDSEKTTLSTLLYRPLSPDKDDKNIESRDNNQEQDDNTPKQDHASEQSQTSAQEQPQKPITILWESRGGI
jgi:general secretion pathway protein K